MALAFPSAGKLRPKASVIRCDTAMVVIPKTNLSSELQELLAFVIGDNSAATEHTEEPRLAADTGTVG